MFVPIPTFGILGKLLLSILIIWTVFWKGFGLWKSARNNQPYWFIAIFFLNTGGLLPIIYILWLQRKKVVIENVAKKVSRKKIVKKVAKKRVTKKKRKK